MFSDFFSQAVKAFRDGIDQICWSCIIDLLRSLQLGREQLEILAKRLKSMMSLSYVADAVDLVRESEF
ncbi:hypothetical protein D1823_12950 [Ruegeria sp. AD91A]|nr:hypothetical protein D1823_12950 [Ruegeria sp. AD91A]